MNPFFVWAIALGALAGGWYRFGAAGLALAGSVFAFWLLMQFNRSVKVLRSVADAPVGHVDSAVMLHAKLNVGLSMQKIVVLAQSLGRHLSDEPQTWAWEDTSGARLQIVFVKGRCTSWALLRPSA